MVEYSGGEIERIRQEAGDSLRVVATYDAEGYDVHYVRDDVQPKIEETAEDIHYELVIQGVGREYLERLFDAGELHCSVHRFDELTAFHFLKEGYTGLFVSIDSDGDVPLATFADTCRDLL